MAMGKAAELGEARERPGGLKAVRLLKYAVLAFELPVECQAFSSTGEGFQPGWANGSRCFQGERMGSCRTGHSYCLGPVAKLATRVGT